MIGQVIRVLRRADPARSMPAESPAIREATRESILSSGAGNMGSSAKVVSRPARRRRVVIVAVVAVLFVVVFPAGGAWAYLSYHEVDEPTMIQDFHAAQAEFTLPPGAHWKDPVFPTPGWHGARAGWLQAWNESNFAWMKEWLAAANANDASRKQTAAAAVGHLMSIMPIVTPEEYEKTGGENGPGGFEQDGADFLRSLFEAGKRGDFSQIEQYLRANGQL